MLKERLTPLIQESLPEQNSVSKFVWGKERLKSTRRKHRRAFVAGLRDVEPDKRKRIMSFAAGLLSDWLKSDYSEMHRIVSGNIKRLLEIESRRPGIGEVLHSRFGISNFARYPTEVLIAQRDEISVGDNLPCISFVFSKGDNDGFFYNDANRLLKKLFKDAEGRVKIRIWETQSVRDLIRKMFSSKKTYGATDLAVVNGHGNDFETIFDFVNKKGSALNKMTIRKQKALVRRLAAETLGAKPTIIMNSCSAGRARGLAQEISRALPQAIVIAPSKDMRIERLCLNFTDDEGIVLRPKYAESDVLRVFINGKSQAGNA